MRSEERGKRKKNGESAMRSFLLFSLSFLSLYKSLANLAGLVRRWRLLRMERLDKRQREPAYMPRPLDKEGFAKWQKKSNPFP
jgi:hypothetical protein